MKTNKKYNRLFIFILLFIAVLGGLSLNGKFIPEINAQDNNEKEEAKESGKNNDKRLIKRPVAPQDPSDPANPIYLGDGGVKRSTGDPRLSGYASEAARLGSGYHPPSLNAENIPVDKFNLINWVSMINRGIINPKPSLDPFTEEIPPLDLNILFEMRGGLVDNVVFPHDIHTFWLDCKNCHDEIFIPAAGSNNLKMQEIVKGEWCGRCHGRVAFPIADCTRCHRFAKGHAIEKTVVKRSMPKK